VLAAGDLKINGIDIGASTAADDSASTVNAASSGIAKAAAINKSTSETGVTATEDENIASGSDMTASDGATTLLLNGVDIDLATTSDAGTSRSAVVAAINAVSEQTGVTAVDTGDDGSGVNLVAADGRNIEIGFSDSTGFTDATAAASTGLTATIITTGGYALASDAIVTGDLAKAGLQVGTYEPGVANVSSIG
jgi:flagellin